MQHGVGRPAHGNIQRHGVQESLARGDALRQYALIPFLIIFERILYH